MANGCEIAWFPPSEVHRADPTVLQKGLKLYGERADGCIKCYVGTQIAKEDMAFIVNVWKSVEHHMKFRSTPLFSSTLEVFKAALGGDPDLIDVQTSGNFFATLDCPVTEIAILTLKHDHNVDELDTLLRSFAREISATAGSLSVGWGPVYSRGNTAVITIGWESMAAYEKANVFSDIAVKLPKVVNLTLRPLKLQPVAG